jgi:hypothetical protein
MDYRTQMQINQLFDNLTWTASFTTPPQEAGWYTFTSELADMNTPKK